MKFSKNITCILISTIVLSTVSVSSVMEKRNTVSYIDTAVIAAVSNKIEAQSMEPAIDEKIIKNHNTPSDSAAVSTAAKTNDASKPAESSKTAAKTSSVKPSSPKPPAITKKVSAPPTSKPAELKPTAVAPSSNPVEVAPEVKPAPVTSTAVNKLVLGYGTYYYAGDTSSYNSLKNYGSNIDELATHTYSIKSDGSLTIPAGSFPDNQLTYANSNGIKAIAAIRNEDGDRFSGTLASSVINSPEAKANLINNIQAALKAKNYKGVNIDFEMLSSTDRNSYTEFIKEVYDKLHSQGYLVTIALPAKTNDSTRAYWTYAYDYKSLEPYVDQAILMTYDEHWQTGTPGPIASINWVQSVVNYAASVIPKSKLLLGLGTYGYDWNLSGGYAKSYSIAGAYNTAAKYGAEIQWDDTAKVPYFMYTDSSGAERIVYFEDSTSISYKLNVVNNSGLGGIAIWRLGLEDEKYWTTIKAQIK